MMSANTDGRLGRPRRARFPTKLGLGLGLGLLAGAIAADATGTGLPPVGSQPPPHHASHLELILGSAVNSRAKNDEDDSGLAWGFAEVRISESWRSGLNGGATLIATPELWQDQPGLYDRVFTESFDIRDLYLGASTPDGATQAWVGRKSFAINPVLDGDSQQGIGASLALGGETQLHLAALSRWIKYSRTHVDARGISGWESVAEANPRAGDVYLALSIEQIRLGKHLSLAPFVNYQDHVLAVYGSTITWSQPLRGHDDAWRWELETILAYYRNQVPAALQPDYQDVWSGRIHAQIHRSDFSVGAGAYWIGDRRNDTGAGLFTDFDPMQEDDLYPYNDRNNLHLFYLDGAFSLGKLALKPALGVGRNQALSSNSLEFDLLVEYPLTPRITLAGYVVHVDFSRDVMPNYSKIGTSLSYAF